MIPPQIQDVPESDVILFSKILYNALLQDGTLGKKKLKDGPLVYKNDPIYPKHIALHALLGYLWKISDTKKQIIDVMNQAQLFRPSQAPKASEHRFSPAIAVNDLPLAYYTEQDYERLKQKMMKETQDPISFEEAAFAGYGYEIYEKLYPPKIDQTSSQVPRLYGKKAPNYTDCGEAMLRNFFNMILSKPGGNFDPSLLDQAKGKVQQAYDGKLNLIQEFYRKYKDVSSYHGSNPSNDWSAILSNLNGSEFPASDRNTDVLYADGYYNISTVRFGIVNILNIMGKLTGDSFLSQEWENLPVDPNDEKLNLIFALELTLKLDYLCRLFSREDFVLDWSIDGGLGKTFLHREDIYKKIIFSIGGRTAFDMTPGKGHLDFSLLWPDPEDWRNKTGFEPQGLESIFYSPQAPTPFLNPLIKDRNQLTKVMSFWGNRYSFSLRFLYKLYGMEFDTEHAQSELVQGVDQVLQHGLELRSPLMLDFMKTVLGRGKSILYQAVHYAAPHYKKDIVSLLIEQGVDINGQIRDGSSPLHQAVSSRNKEILNLLLQAKADINISNNQGETPLHECYDIDLLNTLLENGADVHKVNLKGQTPLHLAALNSLNTEKVSKLIEHGANINSQDSSGDTPLHFVVKNFFGFKIVELLIHSKADIDVKNHDGKTPLDLAKEARNERAVKLLTDGLSNALSKKSAVATHD